MSATDESDMKAALCQLHREMLDVKSERDDLRNQVRLLTQAGDKAQAEKGEAKLKVIRLQAEVDALRLSHRRYERLSILGCAPGYSEHLDKGLVLRFSNLDKFIDDDIAAHPSRGDVCNGTGVRS